MELPEAFLKEMGDLLGEELPAYLGCLSGEPVHGLRVNTGKISAEEFLRRAPFSLRQVPWTKNGFYTEGGEGLSRHPWYAAGLYYLQEPSAMLPAALLDVQPGERVLDLCAAPGGKSTELGARLRGQGLLVANDISSSRAKALLKNLELFGVGNALVCSEDPERLLEIYPEYFDRILVDAPCSGEGMFRRDPSMLKAYRERGPEYYAPLQRKILKAAAGMLRPGGRMVYSTCTFSRMENEGTVEQALAAYPGLRCLSTKRLFPQRVRGEGHFAAVLEKERREGSCGGEHFSGRALRKEKAGGEMPVALWTEFASKFLRKDFSGWQLLAAGERLYALPEGEMAPQGLRYLRTGLFLGECARGRFEPSQALAMYLRQNEAVSTVSFGLSDERIGRYLRGETPELTPREADSLPAKGWALVCAEEFPLGWAKCVNGGLRNKYYAGWRWQ